MNLNARHSLFASMLIALGLTIGLGLVEIAVRIFDLAPALPDQYSAFAPDPVLPWRLNPNAIREGKTAEFHYRYEHNAVGFRDRDRKINKDPGTFRIVGIGDSFTYGVGAGADSTFLAQIETTLNRRSRGKVEVINLGIPRYWPDPEALVLEHYGLHYQPDLVLVGVLPNDFLDTRIGTNIRVRDGYLVSSRARALGAVGQWLYVHSHAVRVVLAYAFIRERDERGREEAEPGMEDDEAVWARFHQGHNRMVQLARSVGAGIVFVHIPQVGPWGVGALDLPERLRRFCAKRECGVIDVLPAMMAHPDPNALYYPIDGHCTPAGYALIADVIVRELESQGLLPEALQADPAVPTPTK